MPQQDQAQTVTREATEACGPSLGKGRVCGPRHPKLSRSASLQHIGQYDHWVRYLRHPRIDQRSIEAKGSSSEWAAMTVHSPTWEKASARKARTEPSMVQAAQPTANQHAEYTDHNIYPRDSQILERSVTNHHKRLCLESWHSTLDNTAVNERKIIPRTYLLLIQTQ